MICLERQSVPRWKTSVTDNQVYNRAQRVSGFFLDRVSAMLLSVLTYVSLGIGALGRPSTEYDLSLSIAIIPLAAAPELAKLVEGRGSGISTISIRGTATHYHQTGNIYHLNRQCLPSKQAMFIGDRIAFTTIIERKNEIEVKNEQ